MNLEQDKVFEDRLRKVRPVKPGDEVFKSVDSALSAIQHRDRLNRFFAFAAWGGMGIAATILVVFGLLLFNGRLSKPESPSDLVALDTSESLAEDNAATLPDIIPKQDSFRPVLAENNLKNRIDEGIVFLRNGLTARRYRYEFVDRVVWKNPTNGAVVEMEIPRDELVLIPVQTF